MVHPIKLKIGMFDRMNNTIRNIVFQISVNVPLKPVEVKINRNQNPSGKEGLNKNDK